MQESAPNKISISVEKRKVCGIDVHKSFLVATILDRERNSKTRRVYQDIESLLGLREWILSENCNSVAFESTADYWRSLYAVLQDRVSVTVATMNGHTWEYDLAACKDRINKSRHTVPDVIITG